MEIVLKNLLLTNLIAICLQDLHERKIYVFLLGSAFLCLTLLHLKHNPAILVLLTSSINLGILLGMAILVGICTKLWLRKPLRKSVGLGDVYFFIALAVGFPTGTFVVLLSTSLVFSWAVYQVVKKKLKDPLVPLAGFQALFLFVALALNSCFHISNLYLL